MTKDATDKIEKSEEEWRRLLTPEQFDICRRKGTEIPFSGVYNDCKETGLYRCVCCGAELFEADAKFDSGTGWPSFFKPVSEQAVVLEEDMSLGMRRTEVSCAACDAHLGHVFPDGPAPTGQRYCMNSVSLDLDRNASGRRPGDAE